MAEEEKIVLEREYIIPLRRKFIQTPKYKRAPKAIKALKKFIARNMQIRDGDFNKIKIDKYLNEELWFRGIQKPPHKIKVKVKKFESGIVRVELAELPEKAKWKKAREERVEKEIIKKEEKAEEEAGEKKEVEKVEEKKEEKQEEKIEEKEKEKATIEAGLKQAKEKAREMKHEVKLEKGPKHKRRMALQK